MTRSINKLLIILKDHIQNKKSIKSGICSEIEIRERDNVINFGERIKLRIFMSNHRPMRGEHFDRKHKQDAYWWPIGKKEPRIAWLNNKIKQTEKKIHQPIADSKISIIFVSN